MLLFILEMREGKVFYSHLFSPVCNSQSQFHTAGVERVQTAKCSLWYTWCGQLLLFYLLVRSFTKRSCIMEVHASLRHLVQENRTTSGCHKQRGRKPGLPTHDSCQLCWLEHMTSTELPLPGIEPGCQQWFASVLRLHHPLWPKVCNFFQKFSQSLSVCVPLHTWSAFTNPLSPHLLWKGLACQSVSIAHKQLQQHSCMYTP